MPLMEKEIDKKDRTRQEYIVIPPDGGWGWVVVAAAFYCNMVIDGIQLCFGMILKEMAEHYDTSYASIALVGSLMYGTHLLMGPLCAALCHRFGERAMAFFGSFLTAGGLAVGYFQPPFPSLYLFLGIIGGTGLCFVNMTSIVVTSLYFTKHRVIAVGMVVCGTGAGTVVFALGCNEILKYLKWSDVLLCEAIVALSMAFAVLAYRPLKPRILPKNQSRASHALRHSTQQIFYGSVESFNERRSTSSVASLLHKAAEVLEEFATHVAFSEIDDTALTSSSRKNFFYRIFCCRCSRNQRQCNCREFLLNIKETMGTMVDFHILKSCTFFTFCTAGSLASTGMVIVFFYEKARILNDGVYTGDQATYFVVLLGASTMIWRLLLGTIALLPRVNYYALNIIGLCIGGVAVGISGVYHAYFYFYIWGALYGLATGCFSVFFPVMLLELVGLDKISNATGITMMFMGIFAIMGPPVAGVLQALTAEGFHVIFILAGGMFFVSGLCYTFITGHAPHDTSHGPRNVVLH